MVRCVGLYHCFLWSLTQFFTTLLSITPSSGIWYSGISCALLLGRLLLLLHLFKHFMFHLFLRILFPWLLFFTTLYIYYSWLIPHHFLVHHFFSTQLIIWNERKQQQIELKRNGKYSMKNALSLSLLRALCPSLAHNPSCNTPHCFNHSPKIIIYLWNFKVFLWNFDISSFW